MKNIAIYGAGGLGREMACLLKIVNGKEPVWNLIGFFDDGLEPGVETGYGHVLGGLRELNRWPEPLAIAVAVGYPEPKMKIVSGITNSLIDFPNIIAPDVVFLDIDTTMLGKGNIISLKSSISCGVGIGDFNLFNGSVILGHDVTVGSFNSFMPGVKISGNVNVGNNNLFGLSSSVLQNVNIGNHVTVGAHSLIIKKTKDSMTYMGSPATIVKY